MLTFQNTDDSYSGFHIDSEYEKELLVSDGTRVKIIEVS